jgi:hypothetical protein
VGAIDVCLNLSFIFIQIVGAIRKFKFFGICGGQSV